MAKRIRSEQGRPRNRLEHEDALFERWLDDPAAVDAEFSPEVPELPPQTTPPAPSSAAPSGPDLDLDRPLSLEDETLFLRAVHNMEPPAPTEPVEPMSRVPEAATPKQYRRLDLHGLTRKAASGALRAFLVEQSRRGESWVLVVTGRGNNSTSEPVLISALPAWLRVDNADLVAEFKTAPIRFGGRGATLVRLRRRSGSTARRGRS